MSTAAAGAGTDNVVALAKIMVIDDSQTIRKTAETLLVREIGRASCRERVFLSV